LLPDVNTIKKNVLKHKKQLVKKMEKNLVVQVKLLYQKGSLVVKAPLKAVMLQKEKQLTLQKKKNNYYNS
jgi:hypothetical protein